MTQDLTQLDSRELYEKIEQLRHKAIELGTNWAEAKFEHSKLKELMPSFLSSIQCQYKEHDTSVAETKIFALSDKSYKEKLNLMIEAEDKARLLEVKYKATMESLKALTAVGYVRNSELKLARGS